MTSENPDFLIAAHIGTKNQVQVNEWGYDYGPRGQYWGGYWGPRNVSTYQYEEGSLILDFVNAESKDLIWRGTAKAEVQNINSPEKSEQLINKAVKKILEKFPPPSQSIDGRFQPVSPFIVPLFWRPRYERRSGR